MLLLVLTSLIIIALYLWNRKKEAFTSPMQGDEWFNEYHEARIGYLNDFIKADYIQSYPWMASHPNQLTTAAKPEIIGNLVYRPLNYYDYGEITYIGNPL